MFMPETDCFDVISFEKYLKLNINKIKYRAVAKLNLYQSFYTTPFT